MGGNTNTNKSFFSNTLEKMKPTYELGKKQHTEVALLATMPFESGDEPNTS